MKNLSEQFQSQDFINASHSQKCYFFQNTLPELDLNSLAYETKSDMFEMCANEYFLSKLFIKADEWKILQAPIEEEIENLNYPWTLLVHNLDKYNLNINEVLKKFDCFPKWAFDDIMGSLSSTGSVTPAHIDNYDVFLLQISGKRKWKTQYNPKEHYQEDQPLKILSEFLPDQEFELNPGQMLYVPAGVAHEAHTIEAGLSLSIGVQSLNLLDVFMQQAADNIEAYFTPELRKRSDNNLIESNDFEQIKTKIIEDLLSSTLLENSLLKYVNRFGAEEANPDLDFEEFCQRFESEALYRNELTKFIAIKNDLDYKSSIGDEIISLTSSAYDDLKFIFDQNLEFEITADKYRDIIDLLFLYYKENFIFFAEES